MTVTLRRWRRIAEVRLRRWRVPVAATALVALIGPPVVVLATGSADRGGSAAATIVLWGGWLLGLLLGTGGCGAQLRSGTAALWLQQPVAGPALYLHRLVPRLLLTVLAILLLGGVAMVVTAPLGSEVGPAELRRAAISVAVMVSVAVCIAYGLSGWGVPWAAPAAMLAVVGLGMLAWYVYDDPASFGAAAPLLRVVAFPVDGVGYTGELLAGLPVEDAGGHLLRTVGYAAGWIAVGAVGTAFTTRSPLPRSSD